MNILDIGLALLIATPAFGIIGLFIVAMIDAFKDKD